MRTTAITPHSPVFTLHLKLDHKPDLKWQLVVDPDRYPGPCVLNICRDCVVHKKGHGLGKQAKLRSSSQLVHVLVHVLDFMELQFLHV